MLKNRCKKIGASPGTLIHLGNFTDTKIQISLFEYNESKLIERQDFSLSECLQDCRINKDDSLITWINIRGIHNIETIRTIGTHFGLHSLMLEDIANSYQRSKLDDYKETIYLVMRILKYNQAKETVEDEQVSFILGKNFLITFVETNTDIFEPIRERLRKSDSNTRKKGPDYLCYALIDCIVDNYFLILERVDQNLENLEMELLNNPKTPTLVKIQRIKKDIILLRKTLWPMREVISRFNRIETPLIHDSAKFYMQDVYDHVIQAIETIEGFRDIAGGMIDIYMSNISLRLNEIMKVLTIVSTLFVPLTFIASLYGMNFDYIPELRQEWGYYAVLGVMLTTATGMLMFFRRKKWI